MDNVRKFAFVIMDDFGQIIDRLNLDNVQLPTGLGFKFKYTTLETELTTYFTSIREEKIPKKINIIFNKPYSYQQAEIFSGWVQKYIKKNLYLEYNNTVDTYYWRGIITDFGKTELDVFGDLTCPISFLPSTPKRKKHDNVIEISQSARGFSFPLRLPTRFGSNIVKNNIVKNDYFEKSPLQLFIYGAISNPQITLSENGQIYSTIKFENINITDEEHLLIDSDNSKILLWRNGRYNNAYDYLHIDPSQNLHAFPFLKEYATTEINVNIIAGTGAYLKGSYWENMI